MNPAYKRFVRKYVKVADAIASLDLDQEDREAVAKAVADAFAAEEGRGAAKDFRRKTFVLLASDPLVPCMGADGDGCPHDRVIRQPWHDSAAPDGRSKMWEKRAPYGKIWCVSCGAEKFVPGYREGKERAAAS